MTTIAEQRFPGVPESAAAARRFVAGRVTETGLAHVAALVVDELACNAIRHSRSGWPGGTFTVCVEVAEAWLRIDVADQGGAGTPRVRQLSLDTDGGRGLSIVDALAAEWGVGSHRRGLLVWARCDGTRAPCGQPPAPTGAQVAVAP